MILSPAEFAPPVLPAAAPTRSVRLLGMNDPLEEDEENDMPKGVYDRKRRVQAPVAANDSAPPSPQCRKQARAARVAPGPRFGVFDDGTVHINTEDCQGVLNPEDYEGLVRFVERLRGSA